MFLCPLFVEAVSGTNDFTTYFGATTEVHQKLFGTREYYCGEPVTLDTYFNLLFHNMIASLKHNKQTKDFKFFLNLSVKTLNYIKGNSGFQRAEKFYTSTGNQTPLSRIPSEHLTARPSRQLTVHCDKKLIYMFPEHYLLIIQWWPTTLIRFLTLVGDMFHPLPVICMFINRWLMAPKL